METSWNVWSNGEAVASFRSLSAGWLGVSNYPQDYEAPSSLFQGESLNCWKLTTATKLLYLIALIADFTRDTFHCPFRIRIAYKSNFRWMHISFWKFNARRLKNERGMVLFSDDCFPYNGYILLKRLWDTQRFVLQINGLDFAKKLQTKIDVQVTKL